MRSLLFRTAAVLGVLGLASGAFAQTFQGGVRGIIRDADGGVLPGVTVSLENEGTGVSRTAVTSAVTATNPHSGSGASSHTSGTATAVPQVPGAIGE